MTLLELVGGLLVGVTAGVLSGMFGVGGGIVMTPGLQLGLGLAPITALATPLPVILPTALTGAWRYRKSGEVDVHAALWMVLTGLPASALGAELTALVDTHLLLVITAALLCWQALTVLLGRAPDDPRSGGRGSPVAFAAIGFAAGFVSGLLGIGGGIVMVPLMVGWLAMPLKRALGTSLAAIVVLVVPGTIVHSIHGNVDWGLFLTLSLGAVPGARIGAGLALGTAERTLRRLVGSFLLVVAIVYGALELRSLFGG
jgi:uncharacterized membrane protein YfcA